MTTVKCVLAALAITLTSVAAQAEQYCTGKVSGIYVSADGNVQVNPEWRANWVTICNLNRDRGGASATTCATWFALAAQAVKTQQRTIMYHSASTPCSQIGTYENAPTPGYFMNLAI